MGGRAPLLIQDTRQNPLTCDLPITKDANVGSYLGVPVFYKSGVFYGTLCAVDSKPSNFQQDDISTLVRLSKFFSYVLELENQVNLDGLTGLFNRHYLYRLFDEVITPDDTKKGTVMFLDLDGFKAVNDKYGHEMGDVVLKEVAFRLNQSITEDEIAVRLGGDEFILVYPNLVQREEIEQKADEILKVLSHWEVYRQKLPLSVSIGITIYPNDDRQIRTLLKYADSAMYRAKARGKNNYQFF